MQLVDEVYIYLHIYIHTYIKYKYLIYIYIYQIYYIYYILYKLYILDILYLKTEIKFFVQGKLDISENFLANTLIFSTHINQQCSSATVQIILKIDKTNPMILRHVINIDQISGEY